MPRSGPPLRGHRRLVGALELRSIGRLQAASGGGFAFGRIPVVPLACQEVAPSGVAETQVSSGGDRPICFFGSSRRERSGFGLERQTVGAPLISSASLVLRRDCASSTFRLVRKAAVHRLETRLDLEARNAYVAGTGSACSRQQVFGPAGSFGTSVVRIVSPRRSPRGWSSRVPATAGTIPGIHSRRARSSTRP